MKPVLMLIVAVCYLQAAEVWALPPAGYSHVRHQMPQKERTPVVASEMPAKILSDPSLADEPSKPVPLFGDRLDHVKRAPQNDRQVVGVSGSGSNRDARKLQWTKGAVPSGESNVLAENGVDKREPLRLPLPSMAQRRVKASVPNALAEQTKAKRSVDGAEGGQITDTAVAEEGEDLEKSSTFNVGFYGGGWGGGWGGWGGGYGGGWGGGWGGPYGGWGGPYGGWGGGPYGGFGGWGRPGGWW